MAWSIKTINNATHRVTLLHPGGNTVEAVIPEEYHASPTTKMDYLKSQTNFWDVIKKDVHKKVNYLYVLVAAQSIAILVLVLLRLK